MYCSSGCLLQLSVLFVRQAFKTLKDIVKIFRNIRCKALKKCEFRYLHNAVDYLVKQCCLLLSFITYQYHKLLYVVIFNRLTTCSRAVYSSKLDVSAMQEWVQLVATFPKSLKVRFEKLIIIILKPEENR